MDGSLSGRRLLCGVAVLSAGIAGAEARIESFSPNGLNKDVRQVAVRFSEPMVELGDPERTDPFSINCSVPGRGRWLDERNWVYDFDYDVPGAERCRINLRPGVETVSGERLDGPREWTFHTGGPNVVDHLPKHWSVYRAQIDERQVFLLALDAVVDGKTVGDHAYCRVDGKPDPVALDVVRDAARIEVLEAVRSPHSYKLRGLVRAAGTHLPRGDEVTALDRALPRIVLVQCRGAMPSGAEVDLVWGAGVAAPNGAATPYDQVLSFKVRPPFTADVECSANVQDKCLGSISVVFSETVERAMAMRVRLSDSSGVELPRLLEDGPQVERVRFSGTLDGDTVLTVDLTGPIEDIDGRALANAATFPTDLHIGTLPPGATFGAGTSIVRAQGDAAIAVLLRQPPDPLSGRRVRVADDSEIARWLRRVRDARRVKPVAPWGGRYTSVIAGDNAAERFVVPLGRSTSSYQGAGVPLTGAGLQVLELELPPTQALARVRYVVGTGLATRLAVHFHHGRESSLIWVTDLDSAAPVADATVRVVDGCTGERIARGRTDGDGLARLAGALAKVDCDDRFYLVTARKDDDLVFVTSPGPWWQGSDPATVHTILDRSLYQPGETVSMKHVVRRRTSAGLVLPDGLPMTARLSINHDRDRDTYVETIEIDATGTATNDFELPRDARLGSYRIMLEVGETTLEGGRFRVERFRVGSLRASISSPPEPIVSPSSVPLGLSVRHLAGGGAAYLPVAVRTTVHERHAYNWSEDAPAPSETHRTSATLDAAGEARIEIRDIPRLKEPGLLAVEMDYRDDNGQLKTASERIELWPAAIRLEIEEGDAEGTSRSPVLLRAFHTDGSPATGIPVEADLFDESRYRVERRLPGGFRIEDTRSERHPEAACSGVTNAKGVLRCDIPSDVPNYLLVRATARDGSGNTARAAAWIYGRQTRLVEVEGDRVFVPGDTVPLRVSLPFPEASALVTVEREGVLDAFVTRLSGPDAVVQVPVRPNYAPNVYVSVVLAGDTGTTPVQTEELAVTKSGARLQRRVPYQRDVVGIRVSSAANTLAVSVAPDRDAYRIREVVRASVNVAGPDGLPRSDAEVAMAVVDEALLDLWPNPTWDLLDAMMRNRHVNVLFASSMVGMATSLYLSGLDAESIIVTGSYLRREYQYHSGVDAAAPSSYDLANGARNAEPVLRELFDRLLLWRGRVAMDDDGAAVVDIPLNDLLTSFRIVAVATAGPDLFGTGEATVRTTQDLILRSGLPPTVREGDRFDATFAVRNASDAKRRISVDASAKGLPKLRRRTLSLPPGASQEASWRVTVPAGVERLEWAVTATSERAGDRIAAQQAVVPLAPVRVQQATLVQVNPLVEMPVRPPAEALPDRGGVTVSLRPSIVGGLQAMHEYMARYPYTCLEQRVSAAVALDDPSRWSAVVGDVESYMDRDGLVRFFPSDRLAGSAILTAYLLTIADAAGKTLPEDRRARMIEALRRYLEGDIRRDDDFPNTADALSNLTVLAALARHDAAHPEMLDAFDLDLELLPTSALLDWIDVLVRLDPAHPELAASKDILRGRLTMQGTTMGFSSESRDRLWWLMVSTDGNAARTIAQLLDDPQWRGDMPRMLRGLMGRQRRGRWQTTVANAWGAVATRRFAAAFEADPVAGISIVRLGEKKHVSAWLDAQSPVPVEVPWSAGETLALRHEGTGSPWSLVQFRAAIPARDAVSRGYRIARTVQPVATQRSRTWRRGDVAEVVLTIDADNDMTWVVVEDPLPPGAVVLGSGLGGDSAMLAGGYQRGDSWPVFAERGLEHYRAYYRYVPKGPLTLRYNVRYNTAGTFQLPPTRVAAMYAPEMHGEQPVKTIVVK